MKAILASYGIVAAAAGVLLWAADASAHQAPTGWAYPWACCSNNDCRVIGTVTRKAGTEGITVAETPQGYVISTRPGDVIPYSDPRIKDSPDGEFHWCSVAGEVASRTLCLFVPPRSF